MNLGRCLRLKALLGNENKDTHYFKHAKDRMSKELDIVSFIRLQFMTKTALKIIFASTEYNLLKRQR